MAKKPEVIYEDTSAGPSPATVAAMEAGAGTIGDDLVVERADPEAYEAAVVHPREGIEVVYFGSPRRNGETQWHALARFAPKKFGSVEFVVARRVVAGLAAHTLAGLELAHGRSDLLGHLTTEPTPCERVRFEKAATIRWPSQTRMLYVRWRGLWLTAEMIRKPRPRYIPPADVPGPGKAFPKLSIA